MYRAAGTGPHGRIQGLVFRFPEMSGRVTKGYHTASFPRSVSFLETRSGEEEQGFRRLI